MRENKLLKELLEMGPGCLGMSNVRPMERAMRRRGYEEEEIRDMEMDMDDMDDTDYEDDMGGEDDYSDMSMGDDREDDMDDEEGPDAKKFIDKDEAAEHAKEFLDRANEVLQYNKKEGGSEDIAKTAIQFAKDYYEAIVDEINASKYAKEEAPGEEAPRDEMSRGEEMPMGDEMDFEEEGY